MGINYHIEISPGEGTMGMIFCDETYLVGGGGRHATIPKEASFYTKMYFRVKGLR